MHRAPFVIVLLLLGSQLGHTDDEQLESERIATSATRLMEVFEKVLEHHVAPVSLHEMVHQSVAEGYKRSKQSVPPRLAADISLANGKKGLREILIREWSAMPEEVRSSVPERLPHGLGFMGVSVNTSKEQKVGDQIAANRYVGIGIAIQQTHLPTMARVFPDGPADRAGAKDGDQIVEVDGESMRGLDLQKVIGHLRGPEGTKVDIVIQSGQQRRNVTMTRGVIPIDSISEPEFSASGDTVRIRLLSVKASTPHELRKVEDSLPDKVQNVVLDFSTSNANLHYGKLLANALIDDKPIGLTVDRDGKQIMHNAEPDSLFAGRQLVIYVRSTTGGTLKWIAAALQDTRQAMLLGDPTASSANCVDTFDLSDGDHVVTIPVKELRRADGRRLNASQFERLGFASRDRTIAMLSLPNSIGMRNLSGVLNPHTFFRPAMFKQGTREEVESFEASRKDAIDSIEKQIQIKSRSHEYRRMGLNQSSTPFGG